MEDAMEDSILCSEMPIVIEINKKSYSFFVRNNIIFINRVLFMSLDKIFSKVLKLLREAIYSSDERIILVNE